MIDKYSDEAIRSRDFRALAKLISGIEDQQADALAVADELYCDIGEAHILGVTGMPGSGKSTLVNQLVNQIVDESKVAAIIAIDPTSPFSGGAVLGDRIRFAGEDYGNSVFFRSMATRGHQGGIGYATADIVHVLDAAGFDYVIVETVGAGQLEVDIAYLVDTLVNITTPEAGDDIQAIKAGIMEVGDLFVVNKSDLSGADRKQAQLVAMLQDAGIRETNKWDIPVIKTKADTGDGVGEVLDRIKEHRLVSTAIDSRQRVQKELENELARQLKNLVADSFDNNNFKSAIDQIINKKVAPREVVAKLLGETLK